MAFIIAPSRRLRRPRGHIKLRQDYYRDLISFLDPLQNFGNELWPLSGGSTAKMVPAWQSNNPGIEFDGTNTTDRIYNDTGTKHVNGYPCTAIGYVTPNTASASGTITSICESNDHRAWIWLTNTGYVAASAKGSSNSNSATSSPNTYTAGVPVSAAGLFSGIASRTAYCNGKAGTTTTTSLGTVNDLIYLSYGSYKGATESTVFGGVIHYAAWWGRAFSAAEIQEFAVYPYLWAVPDRQPKFFFAASAGAGGATAYSIDAEPGSYSVTGADATLNRNYAPINAEPGSYSVTGADAGLAYNREINAEPGAYTIGGVDATLTYTGAAVNYEINAEPGSYSVAGADATLNRNYAPLNAEPGAYTITGSDLGFGRDINLNAEPGSYVVDGAAAGLAYSGDGSLEVGGHFGGPIQRVPDRPRRSDVDRDELRRMLEAAFADAPRDAVMVEAKREHPAPTAGPGAPRVDWESMLADVRACAAVLARYRERIASGRTRTQRNEIRGGTLRYSEDSVADMVAQLREQRLRIRRRKAAALLLQ